VSYFAAALARTGESWTGVEVDLDELEDIEALTDLMRDLSGEGSGPTLLMLEENDEYVAIVRVDGGSSGLGEPRVFLSDRRAVQNSDVAAMLWEEAGADEDVEDDDDDEGTRPVAEPVGDTELLADLGTSGSRLVDLCAEEGLLPADILTAVCEKAGCADVLEELREG
jgi:putative tRNA adenosine deaminase-associated protein